MGETRMVDKKFERFMEKLNENFNLEDEDGLFFTAVEKAFKAGRKAQREDMVDEEIAYKHKVTNIGQYL